jgi:predicted nucleic acid-binding protein
MSYVDTSVIISALDELDPRRTLALEALEEGGDKKVSELALVELASVLSRRKNVLHEISMKVGVREENIIVPTIILYIQRRFRLKYRRVDGRKKALLLGDLYTPFATALELSSKLRLKALDLLHLAYVKALIEQGEEIREIITVDEDFEGEKEAIKEMLNVDVRTLGL